MSENSLDNSLDSTEDISNRVSRLLEHFKIRPTYVVANTIYVALKNQGYKDIPTLPLEESNILTKGVICKYCREIEELLRTEPDIEDTKKKTSSKEVFIFQESNMLPHNVYVSEKGDEEKLEDNYIEDDVTSASESENSANSDLEEQEEGYEMEVYDDDESQFSE